MDAYSFILGGTDNEVDATYSGIANGTNRSSTTSNEFLD